ncbi:MAG: hypothetical protein XD84_0208 [Desulfotomaculum sp. 46_80]|nr:MAG: hypothetical protein XD84_0208 [Desulfotomaculum sp. 46_80]
MDIIKSWHCPYNGTVKTVKYFYNSLSRIEKKGKEGCNDSKAKI